MLLHPEPGSARVLAAPFVHGDADGLGTQETGHEVAPGMVERGPGICATPDTIDAAVKIEFVLL